MHGGGKEHHKKYARPYIRTYVYTELSGQRKLSLRTCPSPGAPRPPRPRQRNVHSAWLQQEVIMDKWPKYHVLTRARRQPPRPPSPPSAEHETLYRAVLPLVPFPSVPGLANPFFPPSPFRRRVRCAVVVVVWCGSHWCGSHAWVGGWMVGGWLGGGSVV